MNKEKLFPALVSDIFSRFRKKVENVFLVNSWENGVKSMGVFRSRDLSEFDLFVDIHLA